MQTTDLIERLAADLTPLPSGAAARRLVLGLALGIVAALVGMWWFLGARADFPGALASASFWSKWLFALSVSGAASWMCMRLARPEAAPGALPAVVAAPFIVLGALALLELQAAAPGERMALWLGHSAVRCPWIIAGLAVPVFVGVLWAFRRLAPTRPRLAGFSAGCLAGAVAAAVYAIHCNETAASFVASWYSVGILLPALVGALIGPRVLRW